MRVAPYLYEERNQTMNKETKENITVWSALGMLLFGCVLTVAAFIIPPVAEVDNSILWVFGQTLIYAGGALGIANYARSTAREAVEEMRKELEHTSTINE